MAGRLPALIILHRRWERNAGKLAENCRDVAGYVSTKIAATNYFLSVALPCLATIMSLILA